MDSTSQPMHTKDLNGGGGGGPEAAEAEPIEPSAVNGEFGSTGPFIVVYMIDPFTYGQDSSSPSGMMSSSRLAMIGLLRCYHSMLNAIPVEFRSLIQLQVREIY